MSRRQQAVIQYAQDEVRFLHERLGERPRFTDDHQGLENKIIRPEFAECPTEGSVHRRKRLGGLLNYYYRKAA